MTRKEEILRLTDLHLQCAKLSLNGTKEKHLAELENLERDLLETSYGESTADIATA